MTKATHNGTCQVCGNVQAHNGSMAKHGYTVDWGFFNGVCRGSDRPALELDKSIAEQTILDCNAEAARLEALTLDDIKLVPIRVRVQAGVSRTEMVTAEEFDSKKDRFERRTFTEVAESQLKYAIPQQVKGLRQHVEHMISLIASRHGQPLAPRAVEKEKISEQVAGYKEAVARGEELKAQGWGGIRVARIQYSKLYRVTGNRAAK